MLEEREIIRRCQCGQIRLMDVLIDRYQVALYTLCRKLTRNAGDADDLFQDTWAAAMQKIGTFSAEGRFRPWLFAICVNRYRDDYRKRQRWYRRLRPWQSREEEERIVERVPARNPGPDEQLGRAEQRGAVRAAVQALDDRYRIPVLLHYGRGLSMDEIGEIMGIPAGTVKSRLAHARQEIGAHLERHGHA
ncbi:MAG: sigma-70 family RNA polymerase sigma factor [Candidatus Eisenbacteria sp.]|nr:sigma-70 family RNA polymerase sigma factor [Candidatus Eisenbacteria bacterium]